MVRWSESWKAKTNWNLVSRKKVLPQKLSAVDFHCRAKCVCVRVRVCTCTSSVPGVFHSLSLLLKNYNRLHHWHQRRQHKHTEAKAKRQLSTIYYHLYTHTSSETPRFYPTCAHTLTHRHSAVIGHAWSNGRQLLYRLLTALLYLPLLLT